MCRVRAPSIEAHGSFAFDPEPAIGQARRQLPSSLLRPRVENTTAQPCPCRGHARGHEATLRILVPARTRGTRDASFCWHGQLHARHQARPSASLNPPVQLTISPWDPTSGIPYTLPLTHGEAGRAILGATLLPDTSPCERGGTHIYRLCPLSLLLCEEYPQPTDQGLMILRGIPPKSRGGLVSPLAITYVARAT